MPQNKSTLVVTFFLVFLYCTWFTGQLLAQPAPSERDKKIAVLPLRTLKKVKTPETAELTNWIVFKLFGMGMKNILEHDQTVNRLATATQIDLDRCSYDSCVFDAGSFLQVDHIVWGRTTSDDRQTTLILYLGDVAQKQLINTVTIQVPGPLSSIPSHLPPALNRLFNVSAPTPHDEITQPELPDQPTSNLVTIEVKSEPSEAQVSINGENRGTTPLKLDSLKAGVIEMEINRYGYKPFSKNIALHPGTYKKYLIKLAKRFGTLSVESTPENATVILNQDTLGRTPFSSDTMEPGTYTLDLTLPEYTSFTSGVFIERGKTHHVTAKLVSKAYLDSLKQIKKRKHRIVRRIVFGTLAGGFAALGLYYNEEVQSALDDEAEAYKYYSQLEETAPYYDQSWDAVEKAMKKTDNLSRKRNADYIFSGIFGISFALSIPF